MNSNVKSDIIWELSNAADFSGAFLSTVSLKSRISSQGYKSLFVCLNIWMIWKYITSSLHSMQKVLRYIAFFVQKLTLFCKHNNKTTSISRKDRYKTLNNYQWVFEDFIINKKCNDKTNSGFSRQIVLTVLCVY